MKKYFLLLVLFFTLFPYKTYASGVNNYVNIVNPVRASTMWKSTASVQRQIDLISEYKLPSTWLLQYDIITDDINSNLFKNLSGNQELGIFLEVSEKLATDSYTAYLFGDGDYARGDKVLLSGYDPKERKRMIDVIFDKFKKRFGFYPVSVGAWYIDTISLDYMVEKYHIQAALDVADQYSTDKYGLWGKPWGVPYVPSYFNSLLPEKSNAEKQDLVKIQWAPRDPVKGFGLTAKDSIFSLQANDYINNKLDIDYFKHLVGIYLDSISPIRQLTVGLEVGQEGATFYDEYKKQLQYLIKLRSEQKLSFLTMTSFAQKYKEQVINSSSGVLISGKDYADSSIESYWYSNNHYRIGFIKENNKLSIRDLRIYKDYWLFNDIFTADTSHELKRIIPSIVDEAVNHNSKILFSEVEKVAVDQNGQTVEISLEDKSGTSHTISLLPDKVLVDRSIIFQDVANNLKRYTDNVLAKIIVNYWVNQSQVWISSWRFSSVNDKFYFGFMAAPDTLVGINSKPPFFGVFNFPFQVLIRFKTLPKFSIDKFITKNLVEFINNSTIKITYN